MITGLSLVVVGRNDDYGGSFKDRLFRATTHNISFLQKAGIDFEYLFVEWNPDQDSPLLADEFVHSFPSARSIVVSNALHRKYSRNPHMTFHEMPAKNVGIRRADKDWILALNADIMLEESIFDRLASGKLDPNTIYRAHRIDVPPELSWIEMKKPENQLASCEGVLPPCYYLGAAGDFCLGHRSAWHTMRGFNETTRFSTRCKDWQFFLNATVRGFNTEFIGRVYHMDHEMGFRNTPPEKRDAPNVHFGTSWDIEFGLPVENRKDWGLSATAAGQESASLKTVPIVHLPETAFPDDADLERQGKILQQWLSPPAEGTGIFDSPILFHLLLQACCNDLSIFCQLQNSQTAAQVAALSAVGAPHGLKLFSNWKWEPLPGISPMPFKRIPSGKNPDWTLIQEREILYLNGERLDDRAAFLPENFRIGRPSFNPLLARRLFKLYLDLYNSGTGTIALYGAGTHTRELLKWGIPDFLKLETILVTDLKTKTWEGLPMHSIKIFDPNSIDALVLSSSSYETEMMETARQYGYEAVYPLYFNWPAFRFAVHAEDP